MTENRYHDGHQDEANRARALQRHEAEIRETEERWQRRLWATMPVGQIASSGDFWESKL